MSTYATSFRINLGVAGFTLKAALEAGGTIDATFRDITTGIADMGQGVYRFDTTAIPSGFRGGIYFYTGTLGVGSTFSGVAVKAVGAINPENIEDIDAILAAVPAGSGPKAVTIHVTDGTSALGGVLIMVVNGANVGVASGISDSSGNLVVGLLASTTYTINTFLLGYTSTPSSQTTSSGNGSQTLTTIALTAITSTPVGALTKTQLRDAIKREARVTGTELDTLIYDIINDVVVDVFSKERCYELRVIGSGTSMSNASPVIALPSDFQHVDEVRFSTDNGATSRKLLPKNDSSYNKGTGSPQFWQIVGANLYAFPYSQALSSHKIYLDYFKTPTFASDSDAFPVVRLQATVKKECITRILEYENTLEQAARMDASAAKSLDRGKSANLEARERDSIDTRLPNFTTVPQDTK